MFAPCLFLGASSYIAIFMFHALKFPYLHLSLYPPTLSGHPSSIFDFWGLLDVPAAVWQVASTATTPGKAKLLLFDNQCTWKETLKTTEQDKYIALPYLKSHCARFCSSISSARGDELKRQLSTGSITSGQLRIYRCDVKPKFVRICITDMHSTAWCP